MRVGQNPAKSIEHVPQPQKVTIAVVSYIPFLSGYYAGSLDVLKACLGSLGENTDLPYDLLVFDNASCHEVRAYLTDAQQQGQLQYLVLSDRNVGKGGAWNFIFQAAPGEVIAYADSDVFFYPGWLRRSLELLEGFPRVGMVTARPLRTPERFFTSTLEWARQASGVQLEQGRFMSWEVFKEHNDSLGVSEDQAQEWFQTSHDWKIEFRGLHAYVGAAHFQFVARKDVLQSLVPFQMDRPMGQVRSLDQKLNEDGFLRLNTSEPLVKHLGNRLSSSLEQVQIPPRYSIGLRKRISSLAPIRRSLMWIYAQIFRLYFE